MELFKNLTEKAKATRQTIVLPEGTETRTLKAADRIIADDIADIILIGDPEEIKRMEGEMGLEHISKARIINPHDQILLELHERRQVEYKHIVPPPSIPF